MSGSASVPNILGGLAGGNQNVSLIDADFTAILNYINGREITIGAIGSRPAAGVQGRWYFATDLGGGTLFADSGVVWVQVALGLKDVLANALVGMSLANDGASPNTTLNVNAGVCSSDDAIPAEFQRVLMSLNFTFQGTIGGVWAVGTGQPKLDTGAVAPSTWYHVFVIERVDTSIVDILFSASAAVPTMPASYTKKRRIGSFLTDGASHIIPFTQRGDLFLWTTPTLDLNANTLGTAAITQGLTVPTGIAVEALLAVLLANASGADVFAALTALVQADVAPAGFSPPYANLAAGSAADVEVGGQFRILTNTSGQIRVRLSASAATIALGINTLGWYDRRGQDA